MKKKKRVAAEKGTKRIREEGSKISNRALVISVATPREQKRFIKGMADWITKNGDDLLVRTEMTHIIQGLNPRHLRDVFLGIVNSIYNTGDAEEVEGFIGRASRCVDEIIRHGQPTDSITGLRKSIDGLVQMAAKKKAA
jgi:hypothetical protein